MVISNIFGGLGNQMFQYAVGRALALRTNGDLKLDISSFEDYMLREFKLECFNVAYSVASIEEVNYCKVDKFPTINKITQKLFNKKFFENSHYFKEKFFQFDPQLLELKDDVYLFGYWQTEKYFVDFKSIILKDFTLKEPLTDSAQFFYNIININNSVSLHVRRGDYVTNPQTNNYHGTCSIDYYKKAVEFLLCQNSSLMFFIFSDDLDWCKDNFDFISDPVFVDLEDSAKDSEEMYLMSQCKHNIIANSSFSWWGAFLNQNPVKIVIAPKRWFADETINTSDLIPNSWIRL